MTIPFLRIKKIQDYCDLVGAKLQHPQITLINYANLPPLRFNVKESVFDYYTIYMKRDSYQIHYGSNQYNQEKDSLLFFAPGQVAGPPTDDIPRQLNDYVLLIHPDFLKGTELWQRLRRYQFFKYKVHNRLSLTENGKKEMVILFELLNNELELYDDSRKSIVVSYIDLILNISEYIYKHQADSSEETDDQNIFERLDATVDDYLLSEEPAARKKLDVKYCAGKLGVSSGYLSQTVLKKSGIPALQYIDGKILEEAKARLYIPDSNTKQVASELGFSSDSYFIRWFKKKTGQTPEKFRNIRQEII